ncbi:MAG: EF-hand domain-containing protein [Burkholderiales bacterium]
MGAPNMAAMQEMRSRAFTKADSSGDGQLDKTEFSSMMKQGPGSASMSDSQIDAARTKVSKGAESVSQPDMDKGAEDMMKSFRSTASMASGGGSGMDLSSLLSSDDSTKTSGQSDKDQSVTDLLQQLLSNCRLSTARPGRIRRPTRCPCSCESRCLRDAAAAVSRAVAAIA